MSKRDQQELVRRITETGYFSMNNASLAKEYLKHLRLTFPKVQLVEGLGSSGLEQVLYLPEYESVVQERLEGELTTLQKSMDAHIKALSQLGANHYAIHGTLLHRL